MLEIIYIQKLRISMREPKIRIWNGCGLPHHWPKSSVADFRFENVDADPSLSMRDYFISNFSNLFSFILIKKIMTLFGTASFFLKPSKFWIFAVPFSWRVRVLSDLHHWSKCDWDLFLCWILSGREVDCVVEPRPRPRRGNLRPEKYQGRKEKP